MKSRNYFQLLLTLAVILACGHGTAAFGQTKDDLDNRVRKLIAQFETLQANAESRIPADNLKKALGVIVMERTKGGFVFGYEQGFGVAMVKNNGEWSPFSFMNSQEGSFGAQIGGKSSFVVILLMNETERDRLTNPKANFGGEAAGTGDSANGGVGGNFTPDSPVLIYGQSKGLYGGAVVKGGAVSVDDKANQTYYGRYYSIRDILFEHKVSASETATEFAKKMSNAAEAK